MPGSRLFEGSALFFIATSVIVYFVVWAVMRVALKTASPQHPHHAKKLLFASLMVPPALAGVLTAGGILVHNQHVAGLEHYFPIDLPYWIPREAAILLQGAIWLLLCAVAYRLAMLYRASFLLARDLNYALLPPSGRLTSVIKTLSEDFPTSRMAFHEADIPMSYSCVTGFFRARYILSRELSLTATDSELKAIVAHELSHFHAGDLWRAWTVDTIRCVFFYVPPVLDLATRWREETEISCDASAAARTRDPLSLASAILRVHGIAVGRQKAATGSLAFADAAACPTVKRVERLLSYVGLTPLKESPGSHCVQWLAGVLTAIVSLNLLLFSDLFYQAHCSLEALVRLFH